VSETHTTSLLGAKEKQGRSSLSDSADSDFSSWGDAGGLAEQLADLEDPLDGELRNSFDQEDIGGSSRHIKAKRVRYNDEYDQVETKRSRSGIVKEDIQIPRPSSRKISRVEHLIAAAMSGGERQMHGLTGRPLVCENYASILR